MKEREEEGDGEEPRQRQYQQHQLLPEVKLTRPPIIITITIEMRVQPRGLAEALHLRADSLAKPTPMLRPGGD